MARWFRRIRGQYKLIRILNYYSKQLWTSDWDRVCAAQLVNNARLYWSLLDKAGDTGKDSQQ